MISNTPDAVRDLVQAWLDGLNTVLGGKVYGVYLYGALAFPEGGATGDIDFHVILNETPSEGEKRALQGLHDSLAQAYPPLGAEMDGYYILLGEARRRDSPRHQLLEDVVDGSWALHCAHIRAGRCIVLHGPDPSQVYPDPSWFELEAALQSELNFVEDHLAEYPAYCVLNLCRLVYSFETRDVVVSKVGSARWAYEAFPEWRPHIEAARHSYSGTASPEETGLIERGVGAFFDFACRHIGESRSRE